MPRNVRSLVAPSETAIVRRGDQGELPDYIHQEEARRMAELASCPRDRLLILALWNTGARISELLRARRCDLDAPGRTLRLPNLKQGRAAEKVVYLGASISLELLGYCEERAIRGTDYLFTAKASGKPISRQTAWKIVAGAAEKVGVRRVGQTGREGAWPHLFRHGHAVHLLRGGVPLSAVKDQLGHASILNTLVYTKLSGEDKRQMIGRVEF